MPRLPEEFEKGDLIGRGVEKNVFVNNSDKTEIIKDFKFLENIEDIKGYYYLTNICHILFPEIVPAVNFVTSDDGQAISIEEYIPHDEWQKIAMSHELAGKISYGHSDAERDVLDAHNNGRNTKEVVEKFKKLGIRIDGGPNNFIRGADGNYKFIEGLIPWNFSYGPSRRYDKEKITQAITDLPEPGRTKASNYLSRLEELFLKVKQKAGINN